MIALLEAGGIPAGEEYPGENQTRLQGTAAAVSLGRMNQETGMGELSIRVLTPRRMGLWECQRGAVKAMGLMASAGMACRLEPMGFEEGCDCFSVVVRAAFQGLVEGSWLTVKLGEEALGHVTEFTAEQDRGRRLIGGVNQETPAGITSGTGGWQFRLVRMAPTFGTLDREPEEPFVLTVTERESVTRFTGCGLNRVKKTQTRAGTQVEWEGFALTREELEGGEAEV